MFPHDNRRITIDNEIFTDSSGYFENSPAQVNALFNMAIFSPLRLRRLADQSTEATQKFITFQIAQQYCALPIDQLVKVIMMEEISYTVQPTGHTVIKYKGQDLVVWDLGKLLFGQTSIPSTATQHQHLLLGRAANDQVVGWLIDTPPATQTVVASALLPSTDLPGIVATITADRQYYVVNLTAIENL
jgi:chemotaxis signal transduction protein